MRIILDADDVLFQCNEYALKLLEEAGEDHYTLEDIHGWGLTETSLDKRLAYFSDPKFVAAQPLYAGAREFIKTLSDKGHEVFVATSVPAKCAGARMDAILRDLPEIPVENIIFGRRKDLLAADVLLDDGVHNIQNSLVKYPVLFRRPWNNGLSGHLAVSSYDEFLTLMELIQMPGNKSGGTKVVTLVGPSGSGKTTVAHQLSLMGFVPVPSTTTRKKRGGKENYHFVSRAEFLEKKEAGLFIETSSYLEEYYGVQKADIEEIIQAGKGIPLLVLDINGAIAMKRHFGAAAKNIYLDRSRERRIRSVLIRELPVTEKVARLVQMDAEEKNAEFCDLVVPNPNGTEAAMRIREEVMGK